ERRWQWTEGGDGSPGDHPRVGLRNLATPAIGERPMNDLVLLTSLWLIPLIGVLVVLAIPKRNESWIPRTALGFTIATFAVSLVALENYMNEQVANRPLEERVRDNIVSVTSAGE